MKNKKRYHNVLTASFKIPAIRCVTLVSDAVIIVGVVRCAVYGLVCDIIRRLWW